MLAPIFTSSQGSLVPRLFWEAELERSSYLEKRGPKPKGYVKRERQQNQGKSARSLEQLAAHPYEHAYIHVRSATLRSKEGPPGIRSLRFPAQQSGWQLIKSLELPSGSFQPESCLSPLSACSWQEPSSPPGIQWRADPGEPSSGSGCPAAAATANCTPLARPRKPGCLSC